MSRDLEHAVSYLITWAWRRTRLAASRVDSDMDDAANTKLAELSELVAGKLAGDQAFERLEYEAGRGTPEAEVSLVIRARVKLALEQAADGDPSFAERLALLISQLEDLAADSGEAEYEEHDAPLLDDDSPRGPHMGPPPGPEFPSGLDMPEVGPPPGPEFPSDR